MIRVAALTLGRRTPSSRFRIRQHVGPLRAQGVEVREFPPPIPLDGPLPGWPDHWRQRYQLPLLPLVLAWQLAKAGCVLPSLLRSHRYDVTWLNKWIVPGFLSGWLTSKTLLRLLGRPYVLDVDDATWISGPLGRAAVSTLAGRARIVCVGNRFLAERFSDWASRVEVVPTAVDTERYAPAPRQACGATSVVVGWIGSRSSLPHLESIEEGLAAFLASQERHQLLVVCDRRPRFSRIPADRVRFVRWAPDIEVGRLQEMDIGLMPLLDTEGARGKCALKMLQYMSCGIPVVVSPIGANAEVLSLGRAGLAAGTAEEWSDALRLLARDPAMRREIGAEGRRIVTTNFDVSVIAARLAEVLTTASEG